MGGLRTQPGSRDRRRGPNVSVPSGDLYPNGVTPVAVDPGIQSTVRPAGAIFRTSPGYQSVRPGRHGFQDAYHGHGIHFTPQRFAEDVGEYRSSGGLPLMVDKDNAASHADIAELAGSDRLDDHGKLTADAVESNEGPYIAEGTGMPTGGPDVRESEKTLPDMGDTQAGRPLTRAFWDKAFKNPVGVFRSEYAESPTTAIIVAAAVVAAAYALGTEFEREWSRRRRGRGVAATAGTAPAAAASTAGETVKEATEVVNESVTAAGEAAKEATSAAGDAAEAAGKAVDKAAEAVADATTD